MAGDLASKVQGIRPWSLTRNQEFEYEIMKAGIPSCNRVVSIKEGEHGSGTAAEEILFRIQGVLMEVNLGPLKQ